MKRPARAALGLCVLLCVSASARADDAAPPVVAKVEHAVVHGAKAAASGVERGVKAAARGVEKGARATGSAVKKVAGKVGGPTAASAPGAKP
jgi:hypothetical protein